MGPIAFSISHSFPIHWLKLTPWTIFTFTCRCWTGNLRIRKTVPKDVVVAEDWSESFSTFPALLARVCQMIHIIPSPDWLNFDTIYSNFSKTGSKAWMLLPGWIEAVSKLANVSQKTEWFAGSTFFPEPSRKSEYSSKSSNIKQGFSWLDRTLVFVRVLIGSFEDDWRIFMSRWHNLSVLLWREMQIFMAAKYCWNPRVELLSFT